MNPNSPPCQKVNAAASYALPSQKPKEGQPKPLEKKFNGTFGEPLSSSSESPDPAFQSEKTSTAPSAPPMAAMGLYSAQEPFRANGHGPSILKQAQPFSSQMPKQPAPLPSAPSFGLLNLNPDEPTAPPGGLLPVFGTNDKSVSSKGSLADMAHLLAELECLQNEMPVEGNAHPAQVLAWRQRLTEIQDGIRQGCSAQDSLSSAPPAYSSEPEKTDSSSQNEQLETDSAARSRNPKRPREETLDKIEKRHRSTREQSRF